MLFLLGDTIPAAYLFDRKNDSNSRSKKRNFEDFCRQLKYRQVYILPGNHDYYHGYWKDEMAGYQEFFATHNLETQFQTINCSTGTLDDNTIWVATTLWTNMNNDDPMSHQVVRCGMRDYCGLIKHSRDTPSDITTHMTVERHHQHVNYLMGIIDQNQQKNVIVLTHHVPTWAVVPNEFKHDFHFNAGYYSNLDEFILDRPQIKTWIHGHNHRNSDFWIGNCHITSNQRGYPPNAWSNMSGEPFKQFGFNLYLDLQKSS